jgi:hypothetical protein
MDFYSEIGGDLTDAVEQAAEALGDNTHRPISAEPWLESRPDMNSPEPSRGVVLAYRVVAPDQAVLEAQRPWVEQTFNVSWLFWRIA